MQIGTADTNLAGAVSALIARQMADALVADAADLHDARSVAATLLKHGFGQDSIDALAVAATELALVRG